MTFCFSHMTIGRTITLTRWIFVGKVMSLLFKILSRLVIAFLPRSMHLLISWLQLTSEVILEPKKIVTVSPSICHEVMGLNAMIFFFCKLSFKPVFSLSSFTFIKSLFSSSSISEIRVVSFTYLRLLIFLPAILIPVYALSSPAFCMMYSAYKLKRQDVNMQAWWTPFPIWNQSIVHSGSNSCFLTCIQFLRRQITWSGIPISWRIFHSLLWSTQSKSLAQSIKQ